jgi:hypothetical protein
MVGIGVELFVHNGQAFQGKQQLFSSVSLVREKINSPLARNKRGRLARFLNTEKQGGISAKSARAFVRARKNKQAQLRATVATYGTARK